MTTSCASKVRCMVGTSGQMYEYLTEQFESKDWFNAGEE